MRFRAPAHYFRAVDSSRKAKRIYIFSRLTANFVLFTTNFSFRCSCNCNSVDCTYSLGEQKKNRCIILTCLTTVCLCMIETKGWFRKVDCSSNFFFKLKKINWRNKALNYWITKELFFPDTVVDFQFLIYSKIIQSDFWLQNAKISRKIQQIRIWMQFQSKALFWPFVIFFFCLLFDLFLALVRINWNSVE